MKEIQMISAGFEIPWLWVIGTALVCMGGAWYAQRVARRLMGENTFELSFDEFDLLKRLEEAGYIWIARDFNGKLHIYNEYPKRTTTLFIFHIWKAPKNLNINVKSGRVRKHYFLQVSKFSRKPYRISEILYPESRIK